MASLPLTLTLFLTALFIPSIAQVTDPATLGASIKYDKYWSLLPWCINQCLWDNGDNDTPAIGGDIAIHLSCGAPYVNGCYCRPQSATFVHSFITSCASYLCTTPADTDIAAGTDVYAGYCSQALGAGYNPGGEQATVAVATTNVAPSPSSAPTILTIKQTTGVTGPIGTGPLPTSTSQTSSNNGQNTNNNTSKGDEKIAGLSKGAFIGVVVSCTCSVLGLFFGAGFKIYKHKKNNRIEQERVQQLQYNYQPKV